MIKQKERKRIKREKHKTVRKKISGTAERPRLAVSRSLKNIYAQIIDDGDGKTLLSCSTLEKEMRDKIKYGGNKNAAKAIGSELAKRAANKGITKVVFDRGGLKYHGRIKELADAARESGLNF